MPRDEDAYLLDMLLGARDGVLLGTLNTGRCWNRPRLNGMVIWPRI